MSAIRITQSVGLGGVNTPADVKTVQTALNKLLKFLPGTKALAVDGRLSSRPENSKTVAAIKQFQSKVVGMVRPDGKIDPNGRTHKKINEKLAGLALLSKVKTPPVMPVTTAFWMKTAYAEVGETEVAGKKANPRILEYFKASKFWGTDDSGGQNAWCGSFVAWVMQQNNMDPVKNAFRAKERINFGKPISKPVYGAIGIKSRKGGGHVAFVVGQSVDGNYLYMLGGNQSSSVNVAKYKKDVWDDFVVPTSFDSLSASLPIYTQSASVAGSEA
ncbi:TIGR02594 family protein [Pseudoalteromonas sp. CO302Y]|uniref:NlpC/P60 family protein n=1 Tax=unclassified Pseudoalteromonas TaxID=194690 RepID=UPI00102390FF|nr:TIGR02594 family protein [Pseudoalteromonas sp. CO302Y]RZG05865.1 TIGR02594 family protein [Pseudoalteromonas sp. CO133X]